MSYNLKPFSPVDKSANFFPPTCWETSCLLEVFAT